MMEARQVAGFCLQYFAMRLAEVINLLLTAVIAAATVVYALYAYRLWRETSTPLMQRSSAQFINWLFMVAQQAAPTDQPFVAELARICMEAILPTLLRRYKPHSNEEFRIFQTRLEDLFRRSGVDPNNIPGWSAMRSPQK